MKKHMPMMISQRSRRRRHHAPRDEQVAPQVDRHVSQSVGKFGVGRGRNEQSARHAERDGDVERRGFTLFEILLSLGLFLGALAVLSQMWYGGVRASVQSRLRTQAIFRCESKLNEVIAGVVPLQSTSDAPFEDDSTWTWNLQVQPGPHADLLFAVVNVRHPGQGGLSSSSHQLSRLIRDPQVWMNAQQTTTEEQQQ